MADRIESFIRRWIIRAGLVTRGNSVKRIELDDSFTLIFLKASYYEVFVRLKYHDVVVLGIKYEIEPVNMLCENRHAFVSNRAYMINVIKKDIKDKDLLALFLLSADLNCDNI